MPLLFTYGTLLPGHAPACVTDLVARFRPIGPATVQGKLFDLGSYPGLAIDDRAERPVTGFLFELPEDPMLLRRLDAYEGFDLAAPSTSLFRRISTVATLTDGGRSVDCEVYVYNRPTSAARTVASGDWRRHHEQTAAPAPAPFMHKRPIIGITTGYCDDKPSRYEVPADYTKSIERAGGLPVLIPFRTDLSLIPEYADLIDGVVFTGGNDLDPALYGETWHPKAVPIDPDRQRFELAFLAEIERRRTPALGVCLGSQLMNVHRGGSLVQFLPDHPRDGSLEHRHLGDDGYRHEVHVKPGTVLAEAVGGRERLTVNSRHKQAIRELGRGLRVNAVAPDGIIEGFEDPSLPLFLAVQWHPENLSAAATEHLAPFARLIETARSARR